MPPLSSGKPTYVSKIVRFLVNRDAETQASDVHCEYVFLCLLALSLSLPPFLCLLLFLFVVLGVLHLIFILLSPHLSFFFFVCALISLYLPKFVYLSPRLVVLGLCPCILYWCLFFICVSLSLSVYLSFAGCVSSLSVCSFRFTFMSSCFYLCNIFVFAFLALSVFLSCVKSTLATELLRVDPAKVRRGTIRTIDWGPMLHMFFGECVLSDSLSCTAPCCH